MKQEYPIEIHHIPKRTFFEEEGYYFVFHPDFGSSACSATGDTVVEALANLERIREQVIEYYRNTGKDIPEPSPFDKEKNP